MAVEEYHPVLRYKGKKEVKDNVLEFLIENGTHQRSYHLGKDHDSHIFFVRGYPAIVEFHGDAITLELMSKRKTVEGLAKKIQQADLRLTINYGRMEYVLTDRQKSAFQKLANYF